MHSLFLRGSNLIAFKWVVSSYFLAGQKLPANVRTASARCALALVTAVDRVGTANAGVVEAEFLSFGDFPVDIRNDL